MSMNYGEMSLQDLIRNHKNILKKRNDNEQIEKLIRCKVISGYTCNIVAKALEVLLDKEGVSAVVTVGDFDTYLTELMDEGSDSFIEDYDFLIVIPQNERHFQKIPLDSECGYANDIVDKEAKFISQCCNNFVSKTGKSLVFTNFLLPTHTDLGNIRSKITSSEWTYFKKLNSKIADYIGPRVLLCDAEFLQFQMGANQSIDSKLRIESKQYASIKFQISLSVELRQLIIGSYKPIKKLIVLDLDNTLWGGVIGDDGIGGIRLGGTSSLGEAYVKFQQAIKHVSERGVLLAICSKNEYDVAMEPIKNHPDMVLRYEDFISIRANWLPKGENIRSIANELNIGLDSIVFIDDNPAEVFNVQSYAPEVSVIQLTDNPADYVGQLLDSRYFEPNSITKEDVSKHESYKAIIASKSELDSCSNYEEYLSKLQMSAIVKPFDIIDSERISQLINKSNQFNLTTIRRSAAEVLKIADDKSYVALTVRLSDKFADHGLISVVIIKINEPTKAIVDTWIMSCRVLKRGVELYLMNRIIEILRGRGIKRLIGQYRPTQKNMIVMNHYKELGFYSLGEFEDTASYELNIDNYNKFECSISEGI